MNRVLGALPTREISFAVFTPIVLASSGVIPFDANPGPNSIVNLTNKFDCAKVGVEADPRADTMI